MSAFACPLFNLLSEGSGFYRFPATMIGKAPFQWPHIFSSSMGSI
ncbi:hypothetical protein AB434_3734 [Heyndrickxia coagulans]|nr:hypothetical protein AB434_3734 [Heyndrickxia coagulans]KYC64964.1 hypothetical protein B4100_2842 [Heyndrickxia coagulans]KYC91961.1 hypothetical protein B4096_2917 [Heyndrickxia coagulans]